MWLAIIWSCIKPWVDHINTITFGVTDQVDGHKNLLRIFQSISENLVGSGGRTVERRTGNWEDNGSIPPAVVLKLGQFHNPTFACVFRKRHLMPTGGPFYLVFKCDEIRIRVPSECMSNAGVLQTQLLPVLWLPMILWTNPQLTHQHTFSHKAVGNSSLASHSSTDELVGNV